MTKHVTLFFFLFLPQFLLACPMCTDSTGFSDKSRNAYYVITAILAVIPFSLLIGVGLYIRHRAKSQE